MNIVSTMIILLLVILLIAVIAAFTDHRKESEEEDMKSTHIVEIPSAEKSRQPRERNHYINKRNHRNDEKIQRHKQNQWPL